MSTLALIVWILLSLMVGDAAASRGRGRWAWTLVAVLLSPLPAAILLYLLRPCNDRW